jgi:N-acetylglucosamine-6-phosphate deacetylase
VTTVLSNGRIVSVDHVGEPVDVIVEAATIVGFAPAGSVNGERIDLDGMLLAPGLIDVQLNGGWGHDFTDDPASMAAVAAELPSTGVTAFVPTLVTAPADRRAAALAALGALDLDGRTSAVLGLHFEGPIINALRAGAHAAEHAGVPSADELATWSRGGGLTMVTLAPEVDGALAVTAALAERGVIVAAGHTACTPAEFDAARQAGLTMVTHLFNAMAPFEHRRPGPVGATLADASVMASLICDGIHVDPIAVRMAWRALGPERAILVTDATAALGTSGGHRRGRHHLGSVDIVVDGDRLTTADGTLAGSNLTLDRAVRNLITFTGCSVPQAVAAATANPARLLGLGDRGAVEVGRRADLIVLDDQLRVRRTIIAGETAWKS